MNCTHIVPLPLNTADASSPSNLQPCSSDVEGSLHDVLTEGATVESVGIELAPRKNDTTDTMFYSITMERFGDTNLSLSNVSEAGSYGR